MKLPLIFIYGFLFSVSFLTAAVAWHCQMPDVYFVSPEKGVITDFLPPFVTPGASGNFYIRPPQIIYTVWMVYLVCTVAIPAVGTWLLVRLYQRSLKKAWM